MFRRLVLELEQVGLDLLENGRGDGDRAAFSVKIEVVVPVAVVDACPALQLILDHVFELGVEGYLRFALA